MKKLSDTKLDKPPNTSRTFFVDADLGDSVARRLRQAGLQVESHDDHFTEKTPDHQWLAEVGKQDWIALTFDQRIRYDPVAKEAIYSNSTEVFILIGSSLTHPQKAAEIIAVAEKIEAKAAQQTGGFIGKIYASNRQIRITESGNDLRPPQQDPE